MCTGKKYEARIAVILGFDSAEDAVALIQMFRATTGAAIIAANAKGAIQCEVITDALPAVADPDAN